MQGKQIISEKQAIAAVFLMLLSRVAAQGYLDIAGPDGYLSNILAFVMALPLFFMVARLTKLYPGKDLFEILEALLGKFAGKMLTVCCIAYAVILAASTLRGYAYYVYIEILPETPLYFLYLAILSLVAVLVWPGLEVRARTGHFTAWVFIIFTVISLALSLNTIHPEQIKPILYNGFGPVWNGALSFLVFPYGSVVLMLVPFAHLKQGARPFRILALGGLYACIIISLVFVRNLMTLGPVGVKFFTYPTHQAVSLVNIGSFLERLETFPAVLTLLCDVTRLSISVYFAAVGIQRLFNLPDYRLFIVPVVFLVFNYSLLSNDYATDVLQWQQVFPYFAAPFKVILPIALFLIAEIRFRIDKALRTLAQSS